MSTKNETSSLMQNRRDEDDGIYETYGYATGSKGNEDYETPYKEDQYEQPYKGHTYAEYEKPKNETGQIKKKKILLVLVIVLLIAGLAAGIGSYFTMNHEDSEPSESSTESSTEISTKNCEFDKNDECLDAVGVKNVLSVKIIEFPDLIMKLASHQKIENVSWTVLVMLREGEGIAIIMPFLRLAWSHGIL